MERREVKPQVPFLVLPRVFNVFLLMMRLLQSSSLSEQAKTLF